MGNAPSHRKVARGEKRAAAQMKLSHLKGLYWRARFHRRNRRALGPDWKIRIIKDEAKRIAIIASRITRIFAA
ncbi:MAG: hypothetical protein ACXV3D_08280 [Halobacteriota archaeon]